MSRFDFTERLPAPEPTPVGREVGGSYRCQTCDEPVRKAMYNRDELELVWTCSQGHTSYVKGLDI